MAKKKKTTSKKKKPRKKRSFVLSKQQKVLLGSLFMLLGVMLLFSFISYFFTWQADQSELGILDNRDAPAENWLNKFGSHVGNFFIYEGFGISAFILAVLITLTGAYLFFDYAKKQLKRFWFWGILVMIWLSVFFGFFSTTSSLLSGVIGYETNDYLQDYLGLIGTICVMVFLAIVYLVLRLNVTPDKVSAYFKSVKKEVASDFSSEEDPVSQTDYEKEVVSTLVSEENTPSELTIEKTVEEPVLKSEVQEVIASEDSVAMEVEQIKEEDEVDTMSKKLVEDFGQFDPTLELSNFKFPSIELLKDYTAGQGITINQEELEENKNRIVDTLSNYKIGISNIKATVGPTVTLYEIVPEAGIRISKIKNLEDDIALSLSALGIRIIAPIPGRGTIGIEVPNKNPKIVSMRSVIASPKFHNGF